MGLIASRDFVDACAVRPLPDGGLITAASAVEAFPETPGRVRGRNKSCGLTFRPTGERDSYAHLRLLLCIHLRTFVVFFEL